MIRNDIAAAHAVFRGEQTRGLAGGLRVVTSGHGLVIDGENLGLACEKRDLRNAIGSLDGREQARGSVERSLRGVGAEFGQFDRGDGVARGEAGMEEHFVRAGAGPLVQS